MHISASVVAPSSTCSPSPHFKKTLFGSRSGSVRAVSGARRPIGWPNPSPDRIHFGKLGNPPTAGRWRCFSSPARRSAHITLPAAPDLDPCHIAKTDPPIPDKEKSSREYRPSSPNDRKDALLFSRPRLGLCPSEHGCGSPQLDRPTHRTDERRCLPGILFVLNGPQLAR